MRSGLLHRRRELTLNWVQGLEQALEEEQGHQCPSNRAEDDNVGHLHDLPVALLETVDELEGEAECRVEAVHGGAVSASNQVENGDDDIEFPVVLDEGYALFSYHLDHERHDETAQHLAAESGSLVRSRELRSGYGSRICIVQIEC